MAIKLEIRGLHDLNDDALSDIEAIESGLELIGRQFVMAINC